MTVVFYIYFPKIAVMKKKVNLVKYENVTLVKKYY